MSLVFAALFVLGGISAGLVLGRWLLMFAEYRARKTTK